MADPYPAGSRSAAPVSGTVQPPTPAVLPHHLEVPPPPPRPDWGPVIREVAGVVFMALGAVLAGVSIFFLAGLPAAGLFTALCLIAFGVFLSYSPPPQV
jgi:hypothetical protein